LGESDLSHNKRVFSNVDKGTIVPAKSSFHSVATRKADPFLGLESGSTEIYLIRHADALPDADDVAHGGYDDQPLSEPGRRQAQALAERMKKVSLAALYSSPIKRAWQTASFVGETLGLEVRVHVDLREVGLHPDPHLLAHLGSEERALAVRSYLHDVEIAALQIGVWSQIPGCESSEALRERLSSVMNRISSEHMGQRIAIVTHSGAINAYIATSLGLEKDFFFPALNTSISIMRIRGKQHLLIKLNDTAHLSFDESDRA
jgi:probable phosphoglycerate mutase